MAETKVFLHENLNVTEMSDSNKLNERKCEARSYTVFLMLLFNYLNCVLGSGIISLPYSLSNSGLGIGLALICFSAVITAYTVLLLLRSAQQFNTYNYMSLVKITLGEIPMHLLAICHFLFPLFIAISYGIVIGDNMEILMSYIFPSIRILCNRMLILAVIYALILLPLCLLKSIKLLEKASAVSIFCVVFYVSVFLCKTFSLPNKMLITPEVYSFAKPGVAQAFSAFYFAMTIHHNLFQLFLSRAGTTSVNFTMATNYTFSISFIVYLIVGVSGFVSFAGNLQGNLLNNYCGDDILINATRFIFVLSVTLTYPFQIFAARQIILSYLIDQGVILNRWIESCTSLILLSSCILVSSLTSAFGPVVEIGGALTAAPMSTIYPTFIYIRQKNFKDKRIIDKCIAWIVFVIGVASLLIGVSMSLYDAIKTQSKYKIPKYWCKTSYSNVKS